MKFHKSAAAILVFAFFTIGAVETVLADPTDSQRLRGLGGRTFEVMVQQLVNGEVVDSFKNCYEFQADGTWIDPGFGEAGAWVQNSTGASTTYTAEAGPWVIPDVLDLVLLQEGTVTPARGRGVLQLEANSYAWGTLFGEEVYFEFLSVGFQNDNCELP